MVAEGDARWEFRATDDDAWYSVNFVVGSNWLTVKYVNFDEYEDEHFFSTGFPSLQDLDDFEKRFRPCSIQLQDLDCQRVVEGLMVCASRLFKDDNSLRFYDAYIEDVQYQDHVFSKGEEECLCNFTLFWQHGPVAGEKINCGVGDICLIQPVFEMDPTLASFFLRTKEIITASLNSGSASHHDATNGDKQDRYNTNSTVKRRSFAPPDIPKESMKARSFDLDGNVSGWIRKDHPGVSLGRIRDSCHTNVIFIKNLDADMAPSAIVEFVKNGVSVSPRVYVFPSLPWDLHTKGIIRVDSKVDFRRVFSFLDDPDHVVTSSSGRPWVISRETLKQEYLTKLVDRLKAEYMGSGCENGEGEVKRVKVGYKKSKRLKDMYVEYRDDVERLKSKLAVEEAKIINHPSFLSFEMI